MVNLVVATEDTEVTERVKGRKDFGRKSNLSLEV
jgi:hypothetical protein